MKEIIATKQLSYRYPQALQLSLHDLSVQVERGEFVLLLGTSGSGKSTFLRALNGLVPRFYGGSIGGQVLLDGKELTLLTQRDIVKMIGFLQQDPERQLLLETVERELVFGLENLAFPSEEMRARLAEMSQLFGLGQQLEKQTSQLSGGEKQRIALASILSSYPDVLLLDEPTSQLDPVHAEEVLQTIRRLNEEWGMTVLMSEHRVERCFHLADRIVLFESGAITFNGTPQEFVASAREVEGRQMFLPPVTRHLIERGISGDAPLTVKAARMVVQAQGLREDVVKQLQVPDERTSTLYRLSHASAGYGQNQKVIRNLSVTIQEGNRIALLGENGAGKSTLAKLLCGALPLQKGERHWRNEPIADAFWDDAWRRIGYLSQNPNDYFLHDTVEGELDFALQQLALSNEQKERKKLELLTRLSLLPYKDRHPHDLSGGEKQRLALALVLPSEPDLLVLDEPTRGLDARQKQEMIHLLNEMNVPAIMIITHDVEFALSFANRVLVLHRGELVADGTPEDVFQRSFAYMPQVYKLYR